MPMPPGAARCCARSGKKAARRRGRSWHRWRAPPRSAERPLLDGNLRIPGRSRIGSGRFFRERDLLVEEVAERFHEVDTRQRDAGERDTVAAPAEIERELSEEVGGGLQKAVLAGAGESGEWARASRVMLC